MPHKDKEQKNAYHRAYYRAHRRVINRRAAAIGKRRRNDRYLLIREIKQASPCAYCGVPYPYFVMDFDHRDPSTKVRDVSLLVSGMVSWDKVLAEISKCDLVCVNCHRLRTYHGSNSYKTRRFEHQKLILDKLKSTTPCLDCGQKLQSCQMDFDHIDSKSKVANIARLVGQETTKLLDELLKCHLVCANCHRTRGHTGVRKHAPEHSKALATEFIEILCQTPYPEDQRVMDVPWANRLGTVTDTALAGEVGISKEMVSWVRRKRGVPAFKPRKLHSKLRGITSKPWHVLAGTVLDSELAHQFHLTTVSICNYRKKVGIPAFTKRAA